MRSGSAAWQNPRAIPKFLSLREDLGFGETARSRLKFGSARRAAPPHFSIRGHLLPFAVPKRQKTAVTTTDFVGRMARGVCLQRRGGFGCSADARFSCPSGECVSPLASGFQRAGYVASGVVGLRQGGLNEYCDAYKIQYS